MRRKQYDDEYWATIRELQECESPRRARELHKRLKKYGEGISFLDRYPNGHWALYVPSWILSVAAIIISIVKLLK